MPLNFASVSYESPFDRDTVERCVREIIRATSLAIAAKRNVELCFSGVGRLTIRERRVKMKFYKEFINHMDSSGVLVDSLMNVGVLCEKVKTRIMLFDQFLVLHVILTGLCSASVFWWA